jgi:hypothetical protein
LLESKAKAMGKRNEVLIAVLVITVCLFVAPLHNPHVSADVYLNNEAFLEMPDYGTYLVFASNVSLGSESYRQGGSSWNFVNLDFNGAISNVSLLYATPDPAGAVMVLQSVDLNGWLNYTVSAVGIQTFNPTSMPTLVIIDGSAKPPNNGWTYSNGTLTISGATAAADISFSNVFVSPTPNSSISPTESPTISQSPQPATSASPSFTTQPTATPQNALFPTQTTLIAVAAIAIIIALFALALKKGSNKSHNP